MVEFSGVLALRSKQDPLSATVPSVASGRRLNDAALHKVTLPKFRTPDLRGLHFFRFLVVDGEFEPEVRAGETGLKLVQLLTEVADGTGSMW